jgi:hypothetical protein
MLHVRLNVDGRDYAIPADETAETIMRRITEQVRAGGGFVEVVTSAPRTVHVFVSPGMSLSIEIVEDDEPGSSDERDMEPTQLEPSFLDPLDLI